MLCRYRHNTNNTAERALRGPVIGRKNFYGSGSVVSAELASRAGTITATAARAGLNPLAYLTAYLHACAHAGGTAPTGQALTRFLPWTADPDDRTAWAHGPPPTTDTTGSEPDTTDTTGSEPDTTDTTGSEPDPIDTTGSEPDTGGEDGPRAGPPP